MWPRSAASPVADCDRDKHGDEATPLQHVACTVVASRNGTAVVLMGRSSVASAADESGKSTRSLRPLQLISGIGSRSHMFRRPAQEGGRYGPGDGLRTDGVRVRSKSASRIDTCGVRRTIAVRDVGQICRPLQDPCADRKQQEARQRQLAVESLQACSTSTPTETA